MPYGEVAGLQARLDNGLKRVDVFATGNFGLDPVHYEATFRKPEIPLQIAPSLLLAEPFLFPQAIGRTVEGLGAGDQVMLEADPGDVDLFVSGQLSQGFLLDMSLTSRIEPLPELQPQLALQLGGLFRAAAGEGEVDVDVDIDWTLNGERIPVIGNLFKAQRDGQWRQRNLLIFLTPNLVDGDGLEQQVEGLTPLEQLLAGHAVESRFVLRFGVSEPVEMDVDNLTLGLVVIPEPSTAVLAWAGALGLAVRRRRRAGG